jgi:hypothetical protein
MSRSRPAWVRVLRFYEVGDEGAGFRPVDALLEGQVHARSRYRSVADDSRLAVYSVYNAADVPAGAFGLDEHVLVGVREFRRVPLDASSLGLMLFTARPARAVQVVAALAEFVEHAVVAYQPGYALVAHLLAAPHTSLLLTAVQDATALGEAASAAFNLDRLLAELDPLLDTAPECYAYCPEAAPVPAVGVVSPYAV